MPGGKPAGVACVNLDTERQLCRIWGTAQYPEVCRRFAAEPAVCGNTRDEALVIIARLETLTSGCVRRDT
jgi:hypothetical protein